ncbi:MAG: T9SS type A sorting domain-containing protein [Candidatus Eisenbacteria bacterium]|nr:T9SS type A sorting domain-containing protein [Candidatus Eisenbacteria bacterium]
MSRKTTCRRFAARHKAPFPTVLALAVIASVFPSSSLCDSPFGVNTHLARQQGEKFHDADFVTYFGKMKDAGILWDRDLLASWISLQPWNWRMDQITESDFNRAGNDDYDGYVARALENGVNIVGNLGVDTPSWASGCRGGPIPDICPPADSLREAFENYVRSVVSRYRGKVKAWEYWNEADGGWADFEPDQYAKWLKILYTVVKSEDPGALVLFSGLASPGVLLSNPPHDKPENAYLFERVLASPELAGHDYPYFDVANFHAYPLSANYDPEYVSKSFNYIKAKMEERGVTKPIWLTEIGETTTDDTLQAARNMKYITFAVAKGVEKVFLFHFYTEHSPWVETQDFGILGYAPSGSIPAERASYSAYKNLISFLADKPFVRDLVPDTRGAHVHLFGNSGNSVVAFWAESPKTISIPVKDGLLFRTYDMFGAFLDSVRSSGGKVNVQAGPHPGFSLVDDFPSTVTLSFDSAGDTAGFSPVVGVSSMALSNGRIELTPQGDSLSLIVPSFGMNSSHFSLLALTMTIPRGSARKAQLYWDNGNVYSDSLGTKSRTNQTDLIEFPLIDDGLAHTYFINLRNSQTWNGRIETFLMKLLDISSNAPIFIDEIKFSLPSSAQMSPGRLAASPNPFTHYAVIYTGSSPGGIGKVEIFDILGRKVREIEIGEHNPGLILWDGRDKEGESLPSGVYVMKLESGARTSVGKVVLIR